MSRAANAWTVALAGLSLVAALGCDQSRSLGSIDVDAGDQHAPTFTEVYELLFPRASVGQCEMCHALPAHDVVNGMLETGMTKDSAYDALVGPMSQSSRCMSRPLIVPGEPDMSLFYLKLLPDPPCGVRMPNGGRQLSDDELEVVRSWIVAGAPND